MVASVESIQYAAGWLADAMQIMVDHECPAFHGGHAQYASAHGKGLDFKLEQKTGHSPPGSPPYKETGEGQASILMEPLKDGARVGTSMSGFNYMAYWNSKTTPNRRPWLSRFFTEKRFQRHMATLMRRHMKMKMGMR